MSESLELSLSIEPLVNNTSKNEYPDTDSKMDIDGDANGFLDPRVLDRLDDLDLPESETSYRSGSESGESEPNQPRIRANMPTGCCYDDRMKLHASSDFSGSPHHPEDPRRIEAIMEAFRDAGLLYDGPEIDARAAIKAHPHKYMFRVPARRAQEQEICLVHTAAHFAWVQGLSHLSSAKLREMTEEFDVGRKSLYVGNLSYEAALISAGGAIETCKNVVEGRVKNGIAVIRPPGHHAEHDEALGFCLFNNVPIAARVCQEEYPEICRKVMILDWDVHHGNGIQNMFYDDPNVLYISIHVYQNGNFYPGQPEKDGIPDGGLDKVGVGAGVGKNINIGWADQGAGDGEYMAAFQRIVMPVAHEFNPDLVIVSAGFDAAAGDDLGGCFVSPQCYSHMTHMLMSLANGRVAVCLEGGYNLGAISRSALAVAKTLMGEPPERMVIPPLNADADRVIDNVRQIHAKYWECLRPGIVSLDKLRNRDSVRGSEMIRIAQKSILSEKFNMVPMYIMRTIISEAFMNQVLCTPALNFAKKILLIVHDPPEILAQPDHYNNIVFPHNTYVADAVIPYIEWAIKNEFAVIDVNIPQSITEDEEDDNVYSSKGSETEVEKMTKEVLCYLWDNFLEMKSNIPIFLMGVGDAYNGLRQLLTNRKMRQSVPGILSFISGSIRPVRSETDPGLSAWYRNSSLIYVSPSHACWSDENSAKKIEKKRFGGIEKADIEGQNEGGLGDTPDMMKRHQKDSFNYITAMVTQWEREHADPDETESDENDNLGADISGNGDVDMNMGIDDELRGVGERSIRVPIGA